MGMARPVRRLVPQFRHGGLDQGGSDRGSEKCSDCGCFQGGFVRITIALDGGYTERRVRGEP